MPALSGATMQSLAQLLDREATHSVIESLYMRFEVRGVPTATNPNKLTKATHLVRELAKRPSGGTTLMALVNYVGSSSFGIDAFRRGSAESADFYQNLDRDLKEQLDVPTSSPEAESPSAAKQRAFKRPGTSAGPPPVQRPESKRYVFVVRGRDDLIYQSLSAFLASLDLRIVTWDEASSGAEGGSPHTLDIVRAGIEMSDAVVVLMTPDDLGQVKPEFHNPRDDPREASPSGQARQNVVFEAGWAMALNQKQVILVRMGAVRPLSDIEGLNYVRLTNDISSRRTLITRLRGCGLAVDDEHDRWRTAGTFPEE